jgi:hypothetical protein
MCLSIGAIGPGLLLSMKWSVDPFGGLAKVGPARMRGRNGLN